MAITNRRSRESVKQMQNACTTVIMQKQMHITRNSGSLTDKLKQKQNYSAVYAMIDNHKRGIIHNGNLKSKITKYSATILKIGCIAKKLASSQAEGAFLV